MIHVAAYCRVSTDKEDQTNSFTSQQCFFVNYIGQNPEWKLYKIYADEGITGTSTQKRIQFNQMIQDAHAGCFQLIVTKEVSRFSRNILDTISYTRELKAIGVGVYFLTQNLNTMDPESEMLLTIMGTLAQEESRRTSVRVKWGQTRQMERGVVFGSSLLGYYVREGRITVNPEEAELVRLIFFKYGIQKKGASVIAQELMQDGYHSHTGNPKWYPSQIIRILKNEKYVGDLVQKKSITPDYLSHRRKKNCGEEEIIVIRNHHEAIISRPLWETVQTELKSRNRHEENAVHSSHYLFSGKIKCGECGKNFVCRYKYLQSKKVRRWSCYTASSYGASVCAVGRLIRDDDARNMLKAAMLRLKLNKTNIISDTLSLIYEATVATKSGQEDILQFIKRSMAQIKLKKGVMLDSYFSGEISSEEMQETKKEYDAQIECLHHQLTELEKSIGTDEDEIRHTIINLLSGRLDSDSLYRCILESLTIHKHGDFVLRLSNLSIEWHFSP